MWRLQNPKHQQQFSNIALDTRNKTSTQRQERGKLQIPFPLPNPLLLAKENMDNFLNSNGLRTPVLQM